MKDLEIKKLEDLSDINLVFNSEEKYVRKGNFDYIYINGEKCKVVLAHNIRMGAKIQEQPNMEFNPPIPCDKEALYAMSFPCLDNKGEYTKENITFIYRDPDGTDIYKIYDNNNNEITRTKATRLLNYPKGRCAGILHYDVYKNNKRIKKMGVRDYYLANYLSQKGYSIIAPKDADLRDDREYYRDEELKKTYNIKSNAQ